MKNLLGCVNEVIDRDIKLNSTRAISRTPRKLLALSTSIIRTVLRGDRFEHLSHAVSTSVENINKILGKKANILDYGCGNMALAKHLYHMGLASSITCVDTYEPLSETSQDNALTYQTIDDFKSKSRNENFDLIIIVNVLHHAGVENAVSMLKELSAKTKFILVIDHLEYSFFSRQILRLSDWFGNYAYGVNTPKKYFSTKLWQKTIEQSELKEMKLQVGVKIYNGVFGMILRSKYHFISVLQHNKNI